MSFSDADSRSYLYQRGAVGVSLKVIISTFFTVFLAELGDKTQLATMLLAAKCDSPVSVFLGSAVALVMSSLVGVAAGSTITRFVSPQLIQNGAGVAFIVIGIFLLWGKL